MENTTKKAPASMGERKEQTVTVRLVKETSVSESAYADFLKVRAAIRLRKQMEKVIRRNSRTV